MSLIQKLFVFLVLAILLPLIIAVVLITADSKKISTEVTSAIHSLETEFTENISMAAENLVSTSSVEFDKLTQFNWERMSFHLANQVASFLYDRDHDLLFLAKALGHSQNPEALISNFHSTKTGLITTVPEFRFDFARQEWVQIDKTNHIKQSPRLSSNQENANKFRYNVPPFRPKQRIPLYKEITIIDLNGNEIGKSSDVFKGKRNITNRINTFAQSEQYFDRLSELNIGEIYVSPVIGAYQPTHIIGAYTEERIKSAAGDFAPETSAFAGLENPKGKRFDGIIRFATPWAQDGKIKGYVTFALDHRHIMEFTDYIVPENNSADTDEQSDPSDRVFFADVKDASKGNYAFMWDNHGRSIAHPREYFITGFDPETGGRVDPWVSKDTAEAFAASGQDDLGAWLEAQPLYRDQSRDKKPNGGQVKSGLIPLDCRHLDFAPQCSGWHQINNSGGYGSFLIYWSGIWKLTTTATIPYYTGDYAESRRGFGFITIGANIGEFTKPGMAASDALSSSLGDVNAAISRSLRSLGQDTSSVLMTYQNQLIIIGALMIAAVSLVTVFVSFNISKRVNILLQKAAEFSIGDFTARVDEKGKDELARIGRSFNIMADTIQSSQDELAKINTNLEQMVHTRTEELRDSNQQISDSIDYASRIQRSLLPSKTVMDNSFGSNAIIWQPKDVVGGDFYWHKTIGDRDYLVVMDCTGHGVPGAFMTLIATSTLEQISAAVMASLGRWVITPDLNDLMQQLHEGICAQLNQVGDGSESNDGLDAIMIAIPHDGSPIEYCGAQMDVYTISQDRQVMRHRGSKTSLGYRNDGEPLDLMVHQLPNDEGMVYVITTDGITTQIGEETHRSYGYSRLINCLENLEDNTPKTINRAIMRDFRSWQGKEERRDDVTLISFKQKA